MLRRARDDIPGRGVSKTVDPNNWGSAGLCKSRIGRAAIPKPQVCDRVMVEIKVRPCV